MHTLDTPRGSHLGASGGGDSDSGAPVVQMHRARCRRLRHAQLPLVLQSTDLFITRCNMNSSTYSPPTVHPPPLQQLTHNNVVPSGLRTLLHDRHARRTLTDGYMLSDIAASYLGHQWLSPHPENMSVSPSVSTRCIIEGLTLSAKEIIWHAFNRGDMTTVLPAGRQVDLIRQAEMQ